jgi:hypothetical protein
VSSQSFVSANIGSALLLLSQMKFWEAISMRQSARPLLYMASVPIGDSYDNLYKGIYVANIIVLLGQVISRKSFIFAKN